MTVSEAILKTQERGAGFWTRSAVKYAQTLLKPEEVILAAVTANISTRKEHFPGVVLLTDRSIQAVCALPGIRRRIVCSLDSSCAEKPSALYYRAMFSDSKNEFSMTIDPDTGEKFSQRIAILRSGTGKEKGRVGYADPKAIAARLAAELAAEENKK